MTKRAGGPLSAIFVAEQTDATRALEGLGDLEDKLGELVDIAQAAWPALQIDAAELLRFVAARLPGDQAKSALERLCVADLALACACAQGVPQALALLEERFFAGIERRLRRVLPDPEDRAEASQRLRERLLVSVDGAPPRIASYTGRGSLAAFVRMTAMRVALNLRRQKRPEQPLDETRAGEPVIADPEVDYLRARYRPVFREALRATLAALSVSERNVLRLFFLDGLTATEIGVVARVSGSTAWRMVARVRAQVLAETRRRLGEKLQLNASELSSMLRLVDTDLEPSVARWLREDDEQATDASG